MKTALSILAAVVITLGVQNLILTPSPKQETTSTTAKAEPAFERVTKTNTLRCGYGIWAPGLTKDPQTGELSGIFYDYLEAIGKHTGLKIEWVGEVGWGDFPAALNSGRIDAMCFGAWPKATEAREVLFTQSVYYLPIYAYARADDTRFDNHLEAADASGITIATMDSELSSEIARNQFPKAQPLSVPQLSSPDMLLMNVSSGKADLTFLDAWNAASYMQNNPNKIKVVPTPHPLRLFGHTIPLAKGEYALAALINAATDEITSSGEFDAILKKYEKMPDILLTQDTKYH